MPPRISFHAGKQGLWGRRGMMVLGFPEARDLLHEESCFMRVGVVFIVLKSLLGLSNRTGTQRSLQAQGKILPLFFKYPGGVWVVHSFIHSSTLLPKKSLSHASPMLGSKELAYSDRHGPACM